MAVHVTCKYLGGKRVQLTHDDSGATLTTSAPKDNQGDGAGFSPTDLVGAALASCMLTIMAIFADGHGIDITGAHGGVEKHMSPTPPRRIARLPVELHLPARLNDAERQKLEAAAKACPVHQSLKSEIDSPVNFVYDI